MKMKITQTIMKLNQKHQKRIDELKVITPTEKIKEYTDDEELIENLDRILRMMSPVENAYDLVMYPMERIIYTPGITVEMCQLIDTIQNAEGIDEYGYM